jgi:hypothetical protein
VSILVRALLGGLVLLFTGSLSGVTAFAQDLSDSADWNDYENYSTSDWGPVVNGVSIRVTAPREISFGDSLTVLLEKRCATEHIKAGVNNWSNSVNGSIVKLEMWPRKGKRSVCSAWRVPDRPSLVSERKVSQPDRLTSGIIGRVTFGAARLDFVPYVPEATDTSTERLGIEMGKNIPAAPGTYDCRVTISIPGNHEGAWSGEVSSDTFQVAVGPEVCLMLPVVLIVPSDYRIGPNCSAYYSRTTYDTVSVAVRPNYYVGISQTDLCGYSIVCGTRCTIYSAPDTIRLDRLYPAKTIALKRFKSKLNGDLWFTGVVSVYTTLSCPDGIVGGTTLWEKEYTLTLTPMQVDSLIQCGCFEPRKEGK